MASSSNFTSPNRSRNDSDGLSETRARLKEMEKLVWKQETRLQNLQALAFQITNYYFVFQGVILAAISNTSSLTCSDRWFLFTLSLLAAIVNILAFIIIALKYIKVKSQYDVSWFQYNDLMASSSSSPTGSLPAVPPVRRDNPHPGLLPVFSPQKAMNMEGSSPFPNGDLQQQQHRDHHEEVNEQQAWKDAYSEWKRYAGLGLCILLLVGFACVSFIGCWKILCGHDDDDHCRRRFSTPHHHHNQINNNNNNLSCFEFCNETGKCMLLCN